jgi:hypothetical protein
MSATLDVFRSAHASDPSLERARERTRVEPGYRPVPLSSMVGGSSMRIVVFAALLANVTPVPAVDLRGVELGQPCRHAAEVELSLGAQPRSDIGSMLEFGVLAFEDQSIAGRHAQYLYSCTQPDRLVSRYSITIRTRSEAEARAAYAEAKGAVEQRLGIPNYDSESAAELEKMQSLCRQGLFCFYALANWTSARDQSVSIGLEKDPDNPDWTVSTSVFRKAAESPNSASGPVTHDLPSASVSARAAPPDHFVAERKAR